MAVALIKDGDLKFDRGIDSYSDVLSLQAGSYAWCVNMLNRGGALAARPGFGWRFTLPKGKLQGFSTFIPSRGKPVQIAFVDGVGYASNYPYTSCKEIQGARMSASAEQVFTVQCSQSVVSNPDGSLRMIVPRQLLMVQDGVNPAAYYDGRVLTSIRGAGATPQGTIMAWAGARLWVARRELVFAGDLGNPLSFMEQTYNALGGVQYFTLPGLCTGMAPIPGAPSVNTPLLVYTDTTTTQFQANVLNRTLWPSTQNFQTLVFPTVGCVAPKSFSVVSGMLWWFSSFGITRLDFAQSTALTTKIYRLDRELTRSSADMFSNMSRICSAAYENLVLISVPHASTRNKHTWVFDGSVNDTASQNSVAYQNTSWSSAWSSIWTGVCPVEWTQVIIGGTTRLFCASKDNDGNNRVYESFLNEKRDNGCDFPWSAELRAYTGGIPLPKHFRFVQYSLSELQGQVNLNFSWAGATRGRWKSFATPTFYAEEGNIDATKEYRATDVWYGLKKQSRITRTQDIRDLSEDSLSSAGVEGPMETVAANKEAVDVGFQIRIDGSGPCALRSIVLFMEPITPEDTGLPTPEEKTGEQFVRFDGAASEAESNLDVAPDIYPASMTASALWHNFGNSATAAINGRISQRESEKRAVQIAVARAQAYLQETAVPYVGGVLAEES